MISLNLDHLPKFDIAPEELRKQYMTYADATMCIFCLGDGWRLPTEEETEVSIHLWTCWHADDYDYYHNHTRLLECVPVRDLKDD
jgi:hypothetical protein